MLGVALPDALAQMPGASSMPNAWVRIGSDDRVTILSARSEMGQGVYTAMPTLVAEELEVDLQKIRVEIAPAGEPYINALLGGQITGGSTSVTEGFDKLRTAGAQARTMLVTRRGAEVGGGRLRPAGPRTASCTVPRARRRPMASWRRRPRACPCPPT